MYSQLIDALMDLAISLPLNRDAHALIENELKKLKK
jgi:hypothetical protein